MEYEFEKERIAAEVLATGFKYASAKRLLVQKINYNIRISNIVLKKNFKLTACNNPEKCEVYSSFPHDLVITEGMIVSGNFCCIKDPTEQFTMGHFTNASNIDASYFFCLRNLMLADMKVKPYVIKNDMNQEVYFYSILKIGDLEFPPVKSNYVEVDISKS